MRRTEQTPGGYDAIAAEYYDDSHLTSRNFDYTTAQALKQHVYGAPSAGLVLEVGAGRGRAGEFLNLAPERCVQLDNSSAMLALEKREPCLLQVLADACSVPFPPAQFSGVVGFLVDPFLGLNSIAEAFRILKPGGQLLFTTPTRAWGEPLRRQRKIDVMSTRFRLVRSKNDDYVVLPSLLHEKPTLEEMLRHAGFESVTISEHTLPADAPNVSPDICQVAQNWSSLPIIYLARAMKPA